MVFSMYTNCKRLLVENSLIRSSTDNDFNNQMLTNIKSTEIKVEDFDDEIVIKKKNFDQV